MIRSVYERHKLERFILKKPVILSGLFLNDRKRPQEITGNQGDNVSGKEPVKNDRKKTIANMKKNIK